MRAGVIGPVVVVVVAWLCSLSAAAAALAAPVPTVMSAPAVYGGLDVGDLLTATPGTWTNSPASYSYQWERCSSTGHRCVSIAGATASGYTASRADVGSTLAVKVAAINSAGASTAVGSSPTAVISRGASQAPPASGTTVPPVSSIRASLKPALKPTGKAASAKEILKFGGYTLRFKVPTKGTLSVIWNTTVNYKPVIVGRARLTVRSAEKVATEIEVKVVLTSLGRKYLTLHERLKIKSVASFTALGLSPTSRSTSFTL
jgi:hypothetical protein